MRIYKTRCDGFAGGDNLFVSRRAAKIADGDYAVVLNADIGIEARSAGTMTRMGSQRSSLMTMYCGHAVEVGTNSWRRCIPYTHLLLAATPLLDPAQRKMSIVVKGEPTAQIDPPSGCVFASRCPYATEQCVAERAMLRQVARTRVGCHHVEAIG